MLQENRLQEIDQVRALAILLVILSHLPLTILHGYIPTVLSSTWTGVDLFFVVSGFVVSRSFALWLKDVGFRPSLLLARNYCLRRMTRILPVAWIWALIPVLLAFTFNESGHLGFPPYVVQEMFAVLRFTYNFYSAETGHGILGQFWSLAVEEHFYVFLPAFLVLVRGRWGRFFGFVAIFFGCTFLRIRGVLEREGDIRDFLFMTQYRVDGLALGCLLGLFPEFYFSQARELSQKKGLYFSALAALCVLVIWLLPGVLALPVFVKYGYLAVALAAGGLVLVASLDRGLLSLPGIGSWMAALGRRSYSLYLAHFPLLLVIVELRFRWFGLREGWPSHWHALGGFLFYLILLFLGSELTYRALELPLIALAKRHFPRPEAPARA